MVRELMGTPLFKCMLGEAVVGLIFHMVNAPNPLFSPLMATVYFAAQSHMNLCSAEM